MLIREPHPRDQAYVFRTWERSLRSVKPYRGLSEAKVAVLRADIEALMDRKDTRALIATAIAPDLCGWIVWTPMRGGAALHYLYVRKDERTRGIGRALIERAGINLAAPLVWTFYGPCHRWLTPKATAAVHLPAANFLAGDNPKGPAS